LGGDVHAFFRAVVPETVVVQPCFLVVVLALEAEGNKVSFATATSDFAVGFQFYFPDFVAPGIISLFRGAKKPLLYY
jgi:hypothetical protein